MLLRLGGEGATVAGVEVGAGGCSLVLAALDGTVRARSRWACDDADAGASVARIAREVEQVCAGWHGGRIIGCGVAVAGIVDPSRDTVASTGLGWDAVPFRRLLAARLDLPVMVTDRGKAMALGELWAREERPGGLVIYLYMGDGVGGALVLDGVLLSGADGTAGEFGHLSLDPAGPVCTCGNRGCLERYVSTAAILEQAGRQTAHPSGRLPSLTVEGIGRAARRGDATARATVAETAAHLGGAVTGLVNALNPGAVILGGPTVQQWGDALLDTVRETVAARALPVPAQSVRILSGQAGDVVVPLGAAALIRERAGELLVASRRRVAVGREVAMMAAR